MKIRILTATIIICAVFATLAVFSAQSQEDIKFVKDDAFTTRMRPPVPFNHDAHNETARLEDCGACHHVYENGKRVEDDASVGTPCSECHAPQDGMPLIRLYHLQCKGCHLQRKAGPVLCSQCHPRRG